MAVPAPCPLPRHRPAPPVEPPSPAEQLAHRMQALPAPASRTALLALTERDLPTTDGLAPPDLVFQEPAISDTLLALRTALGHHPGVFVSGYTAVYDVAPDGGRPVWVVPDVLVAFAVGDHARLSYMMWHEGKAPEFVLEVASVSTWRRDRDEKPALYASLGVREYFLYDPVGGLLEPRLQGHRLRRGGGGYGALRPERLENGERGLRSEALGLWVWLEGPGQALRWHDPATGRDIETHAEVLAAREAALAARETAVARAGVAEVRAERETAARQAAEDRAGVAEDRAEQETAARQVAEDQAERETAARQTAEDRAGVAEDRAERETAARRAAEARIAELEARLGRRDR